MHRGKASRGGPQKALKGPDPMTAISAELNRKERYHPDILNFLRVLAALFVFFLHGSEFIPGMKTAEGPFVFLTKTPAWAGVWIFILLSCYLLGNGFLTGRYDIYKDPLSRKVSVKKVLIFYLKRFIRYAPIYYIYCFAFEFFSDRTFLWKKPGIALRILTFTFNGEGGIAGIGHLWYLSLSMQICLLMPWLFLLISKLGERGRKIVFFAALSGGLAVRGLLWYFEADWYTWVYTFVFSNLDIVVCGILLAMINHSVKEKAPEEKSPFWSRVIGVLCNLQFLLLVIYTSRIYANALPDDYFIYRYILPTLYIVSCGALIIRYHDPSVPKRRPPEKFRMLSVIDRFSEITFPFYVIHMQVFIYFDMTVGNASFYANAPLWGRYIMFFGVCMPVTVLGAIVLKLAIDGVTAGLNRLVFGKEARK